MASGRDGASVRFPPPLVPLIALALGICVQLVAWPLGTPFTGLSRWSVGVALVATGLGLMAAAIGLFRSTGQDPKPWESTPEIISTGIYAWTRNPMYLGMGLLQAGIGLLLANGWIVALVPFSWAAIYWIAVRHEEAYLEAKFGSVYTAYKSSVRRWI
jgi:protein-S-isoprenylcysteine O-methyltransferase Ste14